MTHVPPSFLDSQQTLTDPMTSQSPKSCPFCGEIPIAGDSGYGKFAVGCEGLKDCDTSPATGHHATLDGAIAAWNRRELESRVSPVAPKMTRCQKCGAEGLPSPTYALDLEAERDDALGEIAALKQQVIDSALRAERLVAAIHEVIERGEPLPQSIVDAADQCASLSPQPAPPARACLNPATCDYASRGWCPACEPVSAQPAEPTGAKKEPSVLVGIVNAALAREVRTWRWLHWGKTDASWACPCGNALGAGMDKCPDCGTLRPYGKDKRGDVLTKE
jgi:hypothetical protein